jgi:hypothetical protein
LLKRKTKDEAVWRFREFHLTPTMCWARNPASNITSVAQQWPQQTRRFGSLAQNAVTPCFVIAPYQGWAPASWRPMCAGHVLRQ